jgi:hypothetical protein
MVRRLCVLPNIACFLHFPQQGVGFIYIAFIQRSVNLIQTHRGDGDTKTSKKAGQWLSCLFTDREQFHDLRAFAG